MTPAVKRLNQLLLERKLVTNDQLNEALDIQKKENRPLAAILMERGVGAEALGRALAEAYGMPFVQLEDAPIDAAMPTHIVAMSGFTYCIVS